MVSIEPWPHFGQVNVVVVITAVVTRIAYSLAA